MEAYEWSGFYPYAKASFVFGACEELNRREGSTLVKGFDSSGGGEVNQAGAAKWLSLSEGHAFHL